MVTSYQLALADVKSGEVGSVQKIVGSGSGDVKIGLQVFCGQDFGERVAFIHVEFTS